MYLESVIDNKINVWQAKEVETVNDRMRGTVTRSFEGCFNENTGEDIEEIRITYPTMMPIADIVVVEAYINGQYEEIALSESQVNHLLACVYGYNYEYLR